MMNSVFIFSIFTWQPFHLWEKRQKVFYGSNTYFLKSDIVAIDPDIPLLTGRKPEMGLTTSEQKAHKYENKCYICGVQSLITETVNNEGKERDNKLIWEKHAR